MEPSSHQSQNQINSLNTYMYSRNVAIDDYHHLVGLIQFRESFDLNYPILKPTPSHFNASSQPPLQSKHIIATEIGVRSFSTKESTKRCHTHMEVEKDPQEKKMSHDLTLRLLPPGMNDSFDQFGISSSSSSQLMERCDMPPLVLMGCTHCLIYVMVPKTNPRCPNCNAFVLIDISQQNLAKRSKRSKRC